MGIKPLYYFEDEEKLVFSSEIRSLLASGEVPKRLCRRQLSDYLRYQTVHAPETMVEGVKMHAPASYTFWERSGKRSTEAYWLISSSSRSIVSSREEARQGVKELFYDSVHRRMQADVPFGAFLSGGIDSSAIVGAMARSSDRQVMSFTVNFEEKAFSEARYARKVARLFGTAHEEVLIRPQELLELLPQALQAMDHPSGDGINSFVLSGAIKRAGVTMALTGLGGDELFAGYPVFKRMKQAQRLRWFWKLPVFLREKAAKGLGVWKKGVQSDKLQALLRLPHFSEAHLYAQARQLMIESQLEELLGDECASNRVIEETKAIFDGSPGLFSQLTQAETQTYMQNVLLRDADQMSMAHGLELRVPFLDHRLVELAMSLPDEWKFPHRPKQLLVDSLGGLLPDEVVSRPKMGFVFPWAQWLRGDLRAFGTQCIMYLEEREVFRAGAAARRWDAFLRNDPSVSWLSVWQLMVLGYWLDKNL